MTLKLQSRLSKSNNYQVIFLPGLFLSGVKMAMSAPAAVKNRKCTFKSNLQRKNDKLIKQILWTDSLNKKKIEGLEFSEKKIK